MEGAGQSVQPHGPGTNAHVNMNTYTSPAPLHLDRRTHPQIYRYRYIYGSFNGAPNCGTTACTSIQIPERPLISSQNVMGPDWGRSPNLDFKTFLESYPNP